jgi:pantoate--beta-alanine ligase
MKLFRDIEALRTWARRDDRRKPRVLVPTMGALHEGHLRLIDRARSQADANGTCGEVVVSIFVNPTQFGPNEDLDRYPRTLEADLAGCEKRGADAVFAPDTGEIYYSDASINVRESKLSHGLCGASRPGHFDGVCSVVAKLFNLVEPDAAVFGQKDFQQLAIIRRMVRDLNFPIEVIGEATVREADGLAMSSRNLLLSDEHRRQASVLSASLDRAGERLDAGERDTGVLLDEVRSVIATAADARPGYVEAVDPENLEALSRIDDQMPTVAILVAVYFGSTRLIDNLLWIGNNPQP